jgi:hypothetical protein
MGGRTNGVEPPVLPNGVRRPPHDGASDGSDDGADDDEHGEGDHRRTERWDGGPGLEGEHASRGRPR